MKKRTSIFILSFLIFGAFFNAQELTDWRKMKPEQRKDLINNLSPTERVQLLNKFRENMLVDELEISSEKQQEFKDLYQEYQESQKNIKSSFTPKENYSTLSEEEAKKELERSFVVSQQLLDNRKKYCEKFKKVIKPQQILQMFQNEGMMRNKVMDKKREFNETSGNSPFRTKSGNSAPRGQRR